MGEKFLKLLMSRKLGQVKEYLHLYFIIPANDLLTGWQQVPKRFSYLIILEARLRQG